MGGRETRMEGGGDASERAREPAESTTEPGERKRTMRERCTEKTMELKKNLHIKTNNADNNNIVDNGIVRVCVCECVCLGSRNAIIFCR